MCAMPSIFLAAAAIVAAMRFTALYTYYMYVYMNKNYIHTYTHTRIYICIPALPYTGAHTHVVSYSLTLCRYKKQTYS